MLNHISQTTILSNVVIILDNAPCHRGIEDFVETCESHLRPQIIRMAPYSAPLSPIEMYWSSFKACAKRQLALRSAELVAPSPPGMTQKEYKLQLLENIIDSAIQESDEDSQNSIR